MENNLKNYQSKSDKRRDILIWTLALLLLMTTGYIIYQNFNYKIDNSALTIDANDLERSREILKQELRVLRSDYEDMKKVAKEQDSTINERDVAIFEKQKQIQSILNKQEIGESELQKARKLIISLQTDISDYKAQIAKLTYENKELNAKNLALNTEKDSIKTVKDKVESDLSTTKQSYREHQTNVNSTLSLSNYKIKGINVKSSGREVETTRARRIDKVRVSFDIDANATPSGEKTIYISVHKPDGSLGVFDGASNGEMKLRNGNEIKYSDFVKVESKQGESNSVSFDWVDYDFPKGKYDVDVYENGFKIGQSTIELK